MDPCQETTARTVTTTTMVPVGTLTLWPTKVQNLPKFIIIVEKSGRKRRKNDATKKMNLRIIFMYYFEKNFFFH